MVGPHLPEVVWTSLAVVQRSIDRFLLQPEVLGLLDPTIEGNRKNYENKIGEFITKGNIRIMNMIYLYYIYIYTNIRWEFLGSK